MRFTQKFEEKKLQDKLVELQKKEVIEEKT